MNEMPCPRYEDLIPFLAGDTAPVDVQTHVSQCPDCRRRLDDLRGDLEELRSVAPQLEPALPPAGRPAMIGKYFVVGDLGSGGQSLVYRALHPLLEQEVVIKLSRHPVGVAAPDRHLLVAEGKVLARLEHPNLARVHDLDFHEDRPFLAMEYVRGPNLAQLASEGPVSPRRAAVLVAETARALAVVHRHGVVHQDVKPQNIVMGVDGRPRLIDFGLARLRHALDAASSDPSGGTPAFMAPEQARGEATVGPRSDIFALGGVLYFLLTRKAPFQAENAGQALERAKRCEFDREALRRAGAPRRLEAICLKALAAQPADRYAHAADMAEDLERFARPRRRLLAGVAALLVLVVLASAGVWLATRPTPPATPPAAPVSELAVRVNRNGRYFDLKSALPLQPAADKLEIAGKVPAGDLSVLLYVDTRGQVHRLDAKSSPADAFTRLIWPGEGTQTTLEEDAPGTEFVLLCASPDPAQLAGLDDLVRDLAATLPRLEPEVLIRLDRDEPIEETSGFGTRKDDARAQVIWKLDRLRQHLRERRLSVILGVAFSH